MDEFSLEKVTLSQFQCQLLRIMLNERFPQTQKSLSNKTKIGISGTHKALNGLIEYGLVASIKQDLKAYFIAPQREKEVKTFLTGYDFGKNKPLILSGHASVFEAEMNDLPEKLAKKLQMDKSFIIYNPKNWKYGFKKTLIDGSFKFHKTKNGCKLIAYFRTFGSNPAIIERINNEKFISLKNDLEENYVGLKIGNAECIASCPWAEYAIQKDPLAVAGIMLGIKHKKIEQSYGYPEWEEKGFDAREKIQKIIDIRDKETME